MTDETPRSDDSAESRSPSTLSTDVSTSNYKVLGRLTDQAGIGVLGENQAASGDPVGVYGRVSDGYTGNGEPAGVYGTVPTTDGFGLSTPDDAKVMGDLESTSGHTLTVDGSPTLELGVTDQDLDGLTGGGNVVAGYPDNSVTGIGGTVSGGGASGSDTVNDNVGTRDNLNEVTSDYGTVGGGKNNRASAEATVAGGSFNTAPLLGATVGGGKSNLADGTYATVAGGNDNTARDVDSFVGGGSSNATSGKATSIVGGSQNEVGVDQPAPYATIGGGDYNKVQAERGTIAGGGPTNASGDPTGTRNVVKSRFGTIGGGGNNQAGSGTRGFATVGGGRNNRATEFYSTIAGGRNNLARGAGSAIAGGTNNTIDGDDGVVTGGDSNYVKGSRGTVVGGVGNEAYGDESFVGSGSNNRTGENLTSTGTNAVVPGGQANVAKGDYSFAAGRSAEALNDGAFVWSDSGSSTFSSTSNDQFVVDASGGVGINTTATSHNGLTVKGSNVISGDYGDHIVGIESTTDGGDVLALRNSAESQPGAGTNFVTFFPDATGTSVGAIQGNGSGGVNYKSGNFDLAEYFPKADPDAEFEPGEVVGIRDGQAVANPERGQAALVVSGSPMVTGNVPDEDAEDEFVCLALTGQVPVRVRDSVEAGEVLVADESGRAVSRGASDLPDPSVVGLALADSEGETARTLVGGHAVEAAGTSPEDSGRAGGADRPDDSPDTDERDRRIDRLESEVAELRTAVEARDDRIDELAAANERKDERIADLEDRLRTLEAHVDPSGADAASPADD